MNRYRSTASYTSQLPSDQVLVKLTKILGAANIQADPAKNEHYRMGWRSGGGSALAVLFPQTLLEIWQCLEVCVEGNCIIIMQAAKTGLTEGSTPSGDDYDRPVVVINTLAINKLYLINDNEQIISLPGTTLHQLQNELKAVNRAPHSVIGSSTLGASIVGGVSNNSGGALVKRGPAYTELSLFAQINEHGQLVLVNHLEVELGDTPEEILINLQNGYFDKSQLSQSNKLASDKEYVARIQDVNADTPSRFNADKRRLYEASGCAGKIAVFAVRLDTYPTAKAEQTFYIGSNSVRELAELRRQVLSTFKNMPEVGEYMHRDIFDVSAKYGKDTFLSIKHLGTNALPKLFSIKGSIDAKLSKWSWVPNHLTDKVMQMIAQVLPQHLPKRMLEYRNQYEHHLIIKMSDDGIYEAQSFLESFFADSETGSYFTCTQAESDSAFLHRFAAAGAAIRYEVMHEETAGEILALDIAIPRNTLDWLENLPESITQHLEKKLYYGHFFCYVFHQDYILKKGSDAKQVKKMMLELLNKRGAKYPAEHNVGHLYEAEPDLQQFYERLDPTNTFNPGIGQMPKTKRNCACCL
ncbi:MULTISPECIES: D-lactate dehydrogenase [Psychrobacter]|uniref:D-lactate dehydrogenase n=1 Tax=Psychrobacter TaxID=497 RepID=UPI000E97E3F3|nr:D-lactate dehydrogenase [Psychrobacter sp. KCTC 72983]MED6316744.1 D-lactate dehydrogenase [Pseudomonadota bacterium]HBD03057.1 D-lactate dehydrogenase [Psychrobacter sp.]